jgi:hypothetical protein
MNDSDVVTVSMDTLEIDFGVLFQKIKNSKNKSAYLKQLPKEFHDMLILDASTNRMVKVSDFLQDIP